MIFKDLSLWIEEHQKILYQLVKYTEKVKSHIESDNSAEIIESEVENRERLINTLEHIQGKIDTIIKNLIEEKIRLSTQQIDFIKNWRQESEAKTHQIGELDQNIISLIEGKKENTVLELSKIFKNKMSFKGYNLKDVKR